MQRTESPGAGLNRRPRPYQGRALPTELPGQIAGDDVQLGFESNVSYGVAPLAISNLERETGLEPATPSLEGSRSTN